MCKVLNVCDFNKFLSFMQWNTTVQVTLITAEFIHNAGQIGSSRHIKTDHNWAGTMLDKKTKLILTWRYNVFVFFT